MIAKAIRAWLKLLMVAGIIGVVATLVAYLAPALPAVRFSRPAQMRGLQRDDTMLQFFSYSRIFIQYDTLFSVHPDLSQKSMESKRYWEEIPRFRNWMDYQSTSDLQRVQVAVGFPFRCAACAYDATGHVFGGLPIGPMSIPSFNFAHAGSPGAPVFFNNPSKVLCLTPLPAGISANISIYAIAFLIVNRLGHTLKSRIRSRRGLCQGCGYDLGGNPQTRCPECGQSAGDTAALRKDGAFGSAAIWQGATFTVCDGAGARVEKCAFLYERGEEGRE